MPPVPPDWVAFRIATGRRVVCFVHGFGGDARKTWAGFPEALNASDQLHDWDIVSVGYPTRTSLNDQSSQLSDQLASIFSHSEQIAFVTHSTGGLIVQLALLDHPDLAKRVSHVFFFAAPNGGMRPFAHSSLAMLAFTKFTNPTLEALSPGSPFLAQLNERWGRIFGDKPPFGIWSIGGAKDTVVLLESLAFVPADRRLIVDGDHISLVKPKSPSDLGVQVVINGLLEQTIPQAAKDAARGASALAAKVKEAVFDVFLHADTVDRTELRLLATRVSQEGVRPWLLEDWGSAGERWKETLSRHVATIKSTAICVGQRGPSRIKDERLAVAAEFMSRKLPVIPVFLQNCPADATELPDPLNDYLAVDFRETDSIAFRMLLDGIRGRKPNSASRSVVSRPVPAPSPRRFPLRRKSTFAILGVAFLVGGLTVWRFVGRSDSSLTEMLLDARKPNLTPSRYLTLGDQQSTSAEPHATLLLFVHGIFGDTVTTWKRSNRVSLPSFMLARDEFRNEFDVYLYGFPSSMLAQGSFNVPEAAKALMSDVDFGRFLTKYKRIVIVAHSMGGLVALEALTTFPRLTVKVPLVVTFATPYEGAHISRLARNLLSNPALGDMQPSDSGNSFLDSLKGRWKEAKFNGAVKAKVLCAFETVPLPGIGLIVPKTSSTELCDGTADPIAEDHLGIVKPTFDEHQSVKVLTNALRQLPQLPDIASDIRPEVDSHAPGQIKPSKNDSTREGPRPTIEGLFATHPVVGGTWHEQAFAAQLSFGANGLVAGKYYQHAVQGNWTPLDSASLIFTVDFVEPQDGVKMQWNRVCRQKSKATLYASRGRWDQRIT